METSRTLAWIRDPQRDDDHAAQLSRVGQGYELSANYSWVYFDREALVALHAAMGAEIASWAAPATDTTGEPS